MRNAALFIAGAVIVGCARRALVRYAVRRLLLDAERACAEAVA